MKNVNKYQRQYFMPPKATYDWVKKDYLDHPPIWCSVDLRDGNQALIEPMSLDEKLEFFKAVIDSSKNNEYDNFNPLHDDDLENNIYVFICLFSHNFKIMI